MARHCSRLTARRKPERGEPRYGARRPWSRRWLGLALIALGCTTSGRSTAPDTGIDAEATRDAASDEFSDGGLAIDATRDASPPPALDPIDPRSAPGFVQVGSFNIDWLADHYQSEFTPRLAADYAMIARLIVETDVEIFGLQEIDGAGALELLELPPAYAWAVGRSGWSQNPAILYRADRVQIDAVREVRLPDTGFPSKDPLVARVEVHESDLVFTLVVVHFKPFSDTESAAYRAHQIAALHTWLDEGLPNAPAPDPPVVIVGDFNDTHEGLNRRFDTLAPFEGDPRWVFVERGCGDGTQISYESRIDHLIVDAALAPRVTGPAGTPACVVDRFDERPPYADYPGGYRDRPNISSHRPLWMWIDDRPPADEVDATPR